jgi:hypothetical protein
MSTIAIHLHTNYSDGEKDTAGLIQTLVEAKVEGACLCNHDTSEGTEEFQAATRDTGIESISGIEVSTCLNETFCIHVLAIGFDPKKITQIEKGLQRNCTAYNRYFEEVLVDVNKTFHIELTTEKIRQITNRKGRANFTLPLTNHLINTLNFPFPAVRQAIFGHHSPVWRLLSRGELMTLEEGMNFISEIGATPIFAHPGFFSRYSMEGKATIKQLQAAFELMIDLGLKGAEYHYPYPEDDPKVTYFANEAKRLIEKYNLRRISSSDYHGNYAPKARGVSMPGMTFGEFLKLKHLCER